LAGRKGTPRSYRPKRKKGKRKDIIFLERAEEKRERKRFFTSGK